MEQQRSDPGGEHEPQTRGADWQHGVLHEEPSPPEDADESVLRADALTATQWIEEQEINLWGPDDEHRADGPGAPGPEEGEAEPEDSPRIYVASLSDYNAGILHGEWLDAAVEDDELQAGVAAMLANSPTAANEGLPAEEWAIHDYEGFGPFRLSEYEGLSYVTAVARGIAEHGQAFAAWAAHIGSERGDLSQFEDCYLGEWESVEDYAEEMLNDMGAEQVIASADSWLQAYLKLDVAGFARDLELGGDVTAIEQPDGGAWLFEGR